MLKAIITQEQDSMVFSSEVPTDAIDSFITARKEDNKHVLVLAEDLEDGSLKVTFKYKVSTIKENTIGGVYYKKQFVSWAA